MSRQFTMALSKIKTPADFNFEKHSLCWVYMILHGSSVIHPLSFKAKGQE